MDTDEEYYPKDEGILCKFWKVGQCSRSKDECVFAHSRFKSLTKEKGKPTTYNVEPMGILMKRLRNEEQMREEIDINQCINKIKIAFYNKMPKKLAIVSKKAIYKEILSSHGQSNTMDLRKNIQIAIKHMIFTKELTQTKRSVILNTIKNQPKRKQPVKKIPKKKVNSNKEINIKIEKLWALEQAKITQKHKAAENRNIKEFLIEKYQTREETSKITWKLPQELKIVGVNDENEPFKQIDEIEIAKKQVTEVEEDKIFIWKVPSEIKITETMEDTSIMKELKRIKELQLEKESLVKKLYETKKKVEEMNKKINLALKNIEPI